METHTAGRRILPPVPRAATERAFPAPVGQPSLSTPLGATARVDAGQAFVARLRAAGSALASAAGAETAVVREVVPPARHRRPRCRVVFRRADGIEADLTFVGEHRRPRADDHEAFQAQICAWLRAGQRRDPAWVVPDPDALDGLAVDVAAWRAGTSATA